MRLTIRVALLIGLALLVYLIARQGIEHVVTPLLAAGAALLWIVPLHALPIVLDVLGWRMLLPRGSRLSSLLWIAGVREAFNRLLPVANIGGEIVGVQLLRRTGTATASAAASIVVELLLTLATQYLFVTVGVACLIATAGPSPLGSDLMATLLIALPLIAFLMIVVRYGSIFQRLAGMAERLLGARFRAMAGDNPAALEEAVRDLYRRPARLAAAAGWQLSGHFAGTAETWLVLYLFGHPVSVTTALVLESLSQAARHFIFLVPAGLGVQEATLVGLGHLLGLSSELAIALSLAKRMREILFGSPALLLWYWRQTRGPWIRGRGRREA